MRTTKVVRGTLAVIIVSTAGCGSGLPDVATDAGHETGAPAHGGEPKTAGALAEGGAARIVGAGTGSDSGPGTSDNPEPVDSGPLADTVIEDSDATDAALDADSNAAVAISAGVANMGGGQVTNACAVTAAGNIDCWSGTAAPVQVPTLTGNVTVVSAGGNGEGYNYQTAFVCAVTNVGGAWCWGNNSTGQLGNGTGSASSVPTPVTGLASGVASVSAGPSGSACAVTTDGHLWCWGSNGNMRLGNGPSVASSSTPVELMGFTGGVTSVSMGSLSGCAITTGGGVECWGDNAYGELGNNSKNNSSMPVQVMGLTSGATAVSVGANYACAIVNAGVQCWGNNTFGQSLVPEPVAGLTSGVTSISVAGESSSGGAPNTACAVVNGAVKCWGDDLYGELGDNTKTSSAVPVAAMTLTSGVKAVSVGYVFACAVTTGGDVWCWGGKSGVASVPTLVTQFPK